MNMDEKLSNLHLRPKFLRLAVKEGSVQCVTFSRGCTLSYTLFIYIPTCIKRSPFGQRQSGLIRQVTS